VSEFGGQVFAHRRGLLSDFRHCRRFPETAFERGPDCVYGMRRNSLVVNQGAVVIDLESEKERVGPRESLHKQARDKRLVDAATIGFRPGAIDDAIYAQFFPGLTFPVPVLNLGASVVFGVSRDGSPVQEDPAFALHVGKYVGDFGSDAVPMNVPINTGVTQESLLLGQGQ